MEPSILHNYSKFVQEVTSAESNELDVTILRLMELNRGNTNIALLLTTSLGLSSECGEFTDICKKIIFQGKPLSDDNILKMKRELGDILWYWTNACRALSLDPNEVIQENVHKLEKRFPMKKFCIKDSENRSLDDV
jgi:NTP pyrophosphatase (non-canonical NTP hydrolase)